eukprot:Gregarina_sp_Pseudo_9__4589@NODE_476_length_2748_cov_3140_672204_g450_i0_p1_GENE_NODE_476_length_2748_cov_3140_672204_g450_i0NODE_476_length_2748_cov_3140_672204_g450_i0_p1_ORF_typecomplete_len269_score13_43_NODE_476_length_2748_cov_3140_672204_g450_i08111617
MNYLRVYGIFAMLCGACAETFGQRPIDEEFSDPEAIIESLQALETAYGSDGPFGDDLYIASMQAYLIPKMNATFAVISGTGATDLTGASVAWSFSAVLAGGTSSEPNGLFRSYFSPPHDRSVKLVTVEADVTLRGGEIVTLTAYMSVDYTCFGTSELWVRASGVDESGVNWPHIYMTFVLFGEGTLLVIAERAQCSTGSILTNIDMSCHSMTANLDPDFDSGCLPADVMGKFRIEQVDWDNNLGNLLWYLNDTEFLVLRPVTPESNPF